MSAIDARNQSFGHSVHVAFYARQIAEAAGWRGDALEEIRLGALLHDIGQISWPNELIHKQGTPLTDEERKTIESHTFEGIELIKAWPSLDFLRPYILHHQEWLDGSGYPFGLKGDDLLPEVQVVSLADVYEALRHTRVYRKRCGYTVSEAVAIMREMKGKRWACELFDAFAGVAETWH